MVVSIFKDLIYKQTLFLLTPIGSTVIFKNKYYGQSTNFTTDKNELEKKSKVRTKQRSSDIGMFGNKPFDLKFIRNI